MSDPVAYPPAALAISRSYRDQRGGKWTVYDRAVVAGEHLFLAFGHDQPPGPGQHQWFSGNGRWSHAMPTPIDLIVKAH